MKSKKKPWDREDGRNMTHALEQGKKNIRESLKLRKQKMETERIKTERIKTERIKTEKGIL